MNKLLIKRFLITFSLAAVTVIFITYADQWRASLNPAQQAVAQLQAASTAIALFSPDDAIQEVQLALIAAEQKSIDIAIFSFTDLEVAHALIAAHKRGVVVRIVADRGSSVGDYSKIFMIRKAGIPVYLCPASKSEIIDFDEACLEDKVMASALMHNKFMIFGNTLGNRSLLWTGSYNFTRSANTRNQENVVILSDQNIISAFTAQFIKLLTRSDVL